MTREVDDVLEIVVVADAPERMRNDALAIVRAKSDRTADTGVEILVFGQRGQDNAIAQLSLHEDGWIVAPRAGLRADVKRDVRPRGLRDVFDHRTDA